VANKVLITDALSPIGRAIHSVFQQSPYVVLTPPAESWRWDDVASVEQYLSEHQVDLVVNTVGWVEAPDPGHQLTLMKAADALAQATRKLDCVVIHLSSYRVFGGENKSTYDESDPAHPLGPAGRAFLTSERAFEGNRRYICLRLSWIIDIIGESVFARLLKALTSEGPVLEVTHQRRGTPLSSQEVGRVILAMTHQIFCGAENWGIFHLASGDPCSSAEFTEVVADILEKEGFLKREWRVEKLSEEDLDAQGEPDSAALSVRRCRDNFGYQVRSWRQGLAALIRAWLAEQKLMAGPVSPPVQDDPL
jgi:dTDP-4-dehydrorhamnose reductase